MQIDIGDYVTRISHKHDMVFKVIDIIEDTCYLKGVNVRLCADSLLTDLVKIEYKESDDSDIIERMKENTNSDDVVDTNPKSFQPQNARYETLIQKLYSLCSELGTIVWNFIYIFQTEILTLFNCCQILANKKLLKNKAIFLILLN